MSFISWFCFGLQPKFALSLSLMRGFGILIAICPAGCYQRGGDNRTASVWLGVAFSPSAEGSMWQDDGLHQPADGGGNEGTKYCVLCEDELLIMGLIYHSSRPLRSDAMHLDLITVATKTTAIG